jgi:hypothetical protein
MIKFRQEREGKNGWSRWVLPNMKRYHLACCDCGLVHTMQFRIIKILKTHENGMRSVITVNDKDLQVEFRAKRNKTHTKNLRKAKCPKKSTLKKK